jgi:hypothetical protein
MMHVVKKKDPNHEFSQQKKFSIKVISLENSLEYKYN